MKKEKKEKKEKWYDVALGILMFELPVVLFIFAGMSATMDDKGTFFTLFALGVLAYLILVNSVATEPERWT